MLLVYDGSHKKTRDKNVNYKFQKIAYFSTYFPRYSESSVYREFLKLQELEFEAESIALLRSDPGPIPNDAMGLLDSTVAIADFGVISRVLTHLKRMLTSPIKYWKAFFKQMFDAPFLKRGKIEAVRLFSAGVILARILREKKIEHLHVHHADKPASVALTAHRLTGVPYSITSYSKDLFGKNPDLKAKLENATWVTTISRFHKNYLLDLDPFLEKEKVEVVPVGVDLSIFTPVKDEKNLLQKPRVLAITKLTQNSGIDLLIKASKILASLNVDFETVIVGDGPERARLQSITNKLRLNQYVRLAGARRIEEILDLMRKADVFVLPCGREDVENAEGFPVTAVEAMACGLPVIASHANGIDELVDASTGRIIAPGDHIALARAIQDLLANDVLREKLGRTARQRVANKYNIDETIKGKINLLYPGIPTKPNELPIAWYMLEE